MVTSLSGLEHGDAQWKGTRCGLQPYHKTSVLSNFTRRTDFNGLSINMVTWAGSDVLIPSFLSLNTEIRIELVQTELFLYNRGLTKLLLKQDKL